MIAAVLALSLLAPSSTYLRQYRGALVDAAIANPAGLDGVHILTKCTDPLTCNDLDEFQASASFARASGLDVVPGVRVGVGLTGQHDPESSAHWQRMADIVRQIAGEGTVGLVAIDGENYTGGAECPGDPATIAAAMEPLVSTLNGLGQRVAYYPADVSDACMDTLMSEVGGEAWVEMTFGHSRQWRTDWAGYTRARAETGETAEDMRAKWPGVVVRGGYYDDVIRSWGADVPRTADSWIFDKNRSPDDRLEWGTADWLSGASLSTLNDASAVWAFDPMQPRKSALDERGGPVMAISWDYQAPGYGGAFYNAPHTEGRIADLKWCWRCYDCPNVGAWTYAVSFIAPADVTGTIPILASWANHGSKDLFKLTIEDGWVVATYSHSWSARHIEVLAPILPGEEMTIAFGGAGNLVRTHNGDAGLPAALLLRNRPEVGRLPGLIHGRDLVVTDQVIRWDRLLSADEITTVEAGGLYPWGVQ